jgi:hypothetical protein
MWGRSACLVAVAIVAAGCGAVSEEEPESLADAAEQTEAAKTWRFEFGMKVTGFGDDSFESTGRGEYDHARKRSRTIRENADASEETIVIGNATYQRLAGEPKWIKYEGEAFAEAAATPFGFLGTPLTALALLRETSSRFEPRGEAVIRGTRTVHAHVEIDVARLEQRLYEHEEDAPTARQTLPVDIWVDDEGRVRRIEYEMRYEDGESRPGGSFHGWVEFFDFGAHVQIDLPADAVVVDEEELEARCADPGGTPIPSDRVVATMRRHGFAVRETEREQCMTIVTNVPEEATNDRLETEGWVHCSVTGYAHGAGAVALAFMEGAERPREVTLDAENVSCVLYVLEGAAGGRHEDRFRAAFDELRR